MELRLLKTFLLVARLLNITQAAERLNFTQPAITAQIHNLESALGARLFTRKGKRLTGPAAVGGVYADQHIPFHDLRPLKPLG